MSISIFGLGYVGCVSLGCLARNGFDVIGVEVNKTKANMINKGIPTIIEKDINGIIRKGFISGKIKATSNAKKAVIGSDISIICVGTPSAPNGHLNLEYIFNTARQIGEALKHKKSYHLIAIRSTVLPGTNAKYGKIIEEISGKKRNTNFSVVSNPEFLREGSAVEDYYNPPVTVIGCDNDRSFSIMKKVYAKVKGPKIKTDIKVAEIIKYVNNSYHALKIVFANEVGNICKQIDIDSNQVMNLFCMDKQLNISSYYFKPGFAYGGSCLPKDLKALKTLAHDNYIEVPVLNNIEYSNIIQKEIALKIIESKNISKIAVLGISFKAGTDDLRYSPVIELVEKLVGKGYKIRIFDKNIELSRLIGKNKSYVMEKLPHIAKYLSRNLNNILKWADLIIISNREKEFLNLNIHCNKYILDLCGIERYKSYKNYEGIAW